MLIDPSSVAYDAKRLLGRKYGDSVLQKDVKHWPFKVINDRGKASMIVKSEIEEKALLPQQVSAMVLKELMDIAGEKLGTTPTRAVITVPAYFNDTQRQATKDAARIAKLNVIKLINEPTAAAIAFAVNKKQEREKKVLVYDLGGGTFDVSILKIKEGNIEVIAVNGDTHLGGRDFDNKIVEHFVEEIECRHGVNLYGEYYKKSLVRLRQACEGIKIVLSAPKRLHATLEIDALFDRKDYSSSLTRAKYNEICDDLMRSTLTHVENALRDANLEKENVDEILMVGGSTKIPKIRELVADFFGKKGNVTINPDEAVACGAAIQAALLEGEPDESIADLHLSDVTPLSYGIKLSNYEMSVIINRNTAYPHTTFKPYVTIHDNQNAVDIEIYQGEQKYAGDNHYLGKFMVHDIPRKRAGEIKILLTFEIDENGILVVHALEPSTGVSQNVTVTNALDRLSDEQVHQLVLEAEAMRSGYV